MTTLTRMPGSKVWVETDDDGELVKTYRKAYTALTAEQMAVVMPTNSPSISGSVITLSPLISLTPGKEYRLEIKFTCGGNVWEPWCVIVGEN